MRGGNFHNKMVKDAESTFRDYRWKTFLEKRYCSKNVITYFDLYATKDSKHIACEIETTCRHAIDNLLKAQMAGVPLWIIVPTRNMKKKIQAFLNKENAFSEQVPVRCIFSNQLEHCIVEYMNETSK